MYKNNVYRKERVEGRSFFGIIKNGSYFLSNLAIYEDGIVSAWDKFDIYQFEKALEKKWVVSFIENNEELNVHGIGDFEILESQWMHKDDYYEYIKSILKEMNPEMQNIYKTTQREIEKWEKLKVSFLASPIDFKMKEEFGYDLSGGKSYFIFRKSYNYISSKEIFLTCYSIYDDETISIYNDNNIYNFNNIKNMFDNDELILYPKEDDSIIIENLAKLKLKLALKYTNKKEKLKEIKENIKKISGKENAFDYAIKCYHNYLVYPSDYNRELLKEAYKKVPKHERIFLGNMDNKDSDFRRIIYTPNIKREV
ncbi:hypothetical protein NEI02_08765 [Brachyspira pilosicoli]|uniref:Uncharacterized protein n=1 Tax=Brachyspira pilosicoli TaxID=52584 RepID=A0AAJ6GG08_BRAPL|nr:hypothetical protein [Brachyspira pilosicoli]WIH89791.1 hypothetical protein NEI02_08765 [Brachyspira pilosicoli]WIH92086.1 hypothetical protein NEI01_08765 [Brachyspira pilosicoli]WIH94315.1 hypothetical protein NEH99_08445 [Brachyspira pilosicoli]